MASSTSTIRLVFRNSNAGPLSIRNSLTKFSQLRQFQTSLQTRGQIRDTLRADMKQAMKAKETFKLSVLRGMISEMTTADKEKGHEIADSAILSLLNKSATKRAEVAEFYRTNGRTDLADKESAELEILQSYLPKSLSEAEVDSVLRGILEALKDQPKVNLGQLRAKFFENPDYATTSPAVVVARAKELLQKS